MSMDLKALTEEFNALVDEGESIFSAVKRENREPTKAEQRRIDELYGDENGSEGLVSAKQAELDKAKHHNNQMKLEAATRAAARGQFQDEPYSTSSSPLNRYKDSRYMDGTKVAMLSNKESLSDYVKANDPQGFASIDCKNPLGEFCKAAVCGVSSSTPQVVAAASTNNNGQAGYLVPGMMMPGVIDKARAMSVVLRAGAVTIPMESTTLKMATVELDPAMETKSENASFSGSTITFGQRVLNAYTIGCTYLASRELVEDAPNFAELIEGVMSRALAVELDRLTLQGTGSAQPLGILNDPNLASSAVSSASAPTWQDIGDGAIEIRKLNHEPNAVVMSPANWGYYNHLQTGDGANSAADWLGFPPTLQEQVFYATSNMPEDKILVGDFTKMAWGIRQSALLEVSTQAGNTFANHQVQFKITFRGDWMPMDHDAFFAKTGISL